MNSNAVSPLSYNVIGDELRIGWNSMTPLNLKAAEKLLTLNVRLIGTLSKDETIRFSLVSSPLNELSDASFTTIGDAALSMDMISGSALGIGPAGTNGDLLLGNYPNPFNESTTIAYTLPVNGEVSLVIRDMLGTIVKVMVNKEEQKAGDYKLKLDANSLPQGVYMATLKLITGDQPVTRTIKIVCNY